MYFLHFDTILLSICKNYSYTFSESLSLKTMNQILSYRFYLPIHVLTQTLKLKCKISIYQIPPCCLTSCSGAMETFLARSMTPSSSWCLRSSCASFCRHSSCSRRIFSSILLLFSSVTHGLLCHCCIFGGRSSYIRLEKITRVI